jgi:hypothetical protein
VCSSDLGLPLEWAIIVMGLVPIIGLRRKRDA